MITHGARQRRPPQGGVDFTLMSAACDAFQHVMRRLAAAVAAGRVADPGRRNPPRRWLSSLGAIKTPEWLTSEAGGLVLRFGHLYSPHTTFASDGAMVRQILDHKMRIVGGGTGVFSIAHAHDAATAIMAALSRRKSAALNIVDDDDPALVRKWRPAHADVLSARKPGHVPSAVVRRVAGEWGIAFLTKQRGADNARPRLDLSWRPGALPGATVSRQSWGSPPHPGPLRWPFLNWRPIPSAAGGNSR